MIHKGNSALPNNFPQGFEGTPLAADGRFCNISAGFIPGFRDALRWKLNGNPDKEAKKKDSWRPEVICGTHFLHEKKNCLVWLGHASFYLHLHDRRILIDPVFGRVSIMQRMIPFPCSGHELKNIDMLLISHAHRDHCDEPSLRIVAQENPHIRIFSGLEMSSVLGKWFPKNAIQEAGWFQEFNTGMEGIQLFFVPSRHWSKRWLNDDNKTLWGGFVIRSGGKYIYFMGDSGYGEHFKMIAEKFPAMDYCIMGVGAYKPEWFMGPSHISPVNAVRAFNEIKGKHFIPMHYATFDLSDEPVSEPVQLLKKMEAENEINGKLDILKPGEILLL